MWPFRRSAEQLFRSALAYEERGDHRTAAGLFLKASKEEGKLQPDSFFNLAVNLVKIGDYAGASSAYVSFISLSPESWSPDLEEYAELLREIGALSKSVAAERLRSYEASVLRRQEATTFGGRSVRFEAFFERIEELERTTYSRHGATFGLRGDKLSAKIPLTVYHYPPLSRLTPPAAFELCSRILLWGIAIGHAIRHELGEQSFEFDWPEASKIHYSEAELSRGAAVDWVYVRRATDSVIDMLLERMEAGLPGVSGAWREPIRENLVKEFVFLGLGLALNSSSTKPKRGHT